MTDPCWTPLENPHEANEDSLHVVWYEQLRGKPLLCHKLQDSQGWTRESWVWLVSLLQKSSSKELALWVEGSVINHTSHGPQLNGEKALYHCSQSSDFIYLRSVQNHLHPFHNRDQLQLFEKSFISWFTQWRYWNLFSCSLLVRFWLSLFLLSLLSTPALYFWGLVCRFGLSASIYFNKALPLYPNPSYCDRFGFQPTDIINPCK